jgi:hypothetical protein
MDADIPAARLNILLEGRLLFVIQHIARRVQEHHRAVTGQIRPGEGRTVFRVRDREAVLLADFPKRLDAVFNGAVTESCRFAEHKDRQIIRLLRNGLVLCIALILRGSRFVYKGLPRQKKDCKEKDYGQAGDVPPHYRFFVFHSIHQDCE